MIEKEQFTAEGRKHTFTDICQKLLIKLLTKNYKLIGLNRDKYSDSFYKKTLQQRLINADMFKNEINV